MADNPKPEDPSPSIHTGGGAYIAGGVTVSGGDFVGWDKIAGDVVHGDKVGGDKITVGNISGSSGIAIGRRAQASVTGSLSAQDLHQLFAPLMQAVQAAPSDVRHPAEEKVAALEQEVAKAGQADDYRMAKLIDGLIEWVPGAASAVIFMFASPVLAGLAGPATKFVLDKIQGK